MDAGEAETIALAMEISNVLLILDAQKARRVAQQLELKVIGTVGTFKPVKNSLPLVAFLQ